MRNTMGLLPSAKGWNNYSLLPAHFEPGQSTVKRILSFCWPGHTMQINAYNGGRHIFMQILVDADACPVKEIIVRLAKQHDIPVTMLIDTAHELNDGYSTVVVVDKHADSVDYALMGLLTPEDIVVTQDFGLAAMALGKGARVINQNGLVYTEKNIDRLLLERHIAQRIRRSGGRTKGPAKRTKDDDAQFEAAFEKLLLDFTASV